MTPAEHNAVILNACLVFVGVVISWVFWFCAGIFCAWWFDLDRR